MLRRFFTLTVVALAVLFVTPGIAHADEGLSLPVGTVIRAEPGSVIELGRAVIDQDLAGPLCTWSASAVNQASVHLGNDIIARSGDAELVLVGVEDSPGKVTTATGSAYLADEVIFLLRMGPEGLFSGGLDVSVHYETCPPEITTTLPLPTTTQPEPTTTTTESTTTLVEPTTTVESTTPTTEPASTTTEIAIGPAGPTTLPATTTSSSAAPAPAGPTLPVTGGGLSGSLAAVGATLLVAGIGLSGWSRFAR